MSDMLPPIPPRIRRRRVWASSIVAGVLTLAALAVVAESILPAPPHRSRTAAAVADKTPVSTTPPSTVPPTAPPSTAAPTTSTTWTQPLMPVGAVAPAPSGPLPTCTPAELESDFLGTGGLWTTDTPGVSTSISKSACTATFAVGTAPNDAAIFYYLADEQMWQLEWAGPSSAAPAEYAQWSQQVGQPGLFATIAAQVSTIGTEVIVK